MLAISRWKRSVSTSRSTWVWLSPPCQAYARPSHVHYDDPKAVFPTFEDLGVRDLTRLGREYVIENVVGCDDLRDPVELNGVAFGERYVYRRLFETSFDLPSGPSAPIPSKRRCRWTALVRKSTPV